MLSLCVAVAAYSATATSCESAGYATCSDCSIDNYSTMGGTSYSDCGDCYVDCGCATACCDYRPWAHKTSIWGEFLYLHPTGADMVHAQQQNGAGGAGTVPWGIIGSADPHYEPGYRIGGAFACDACSSVTAAYTHFESDALNVVTAPFIPGGGGAVGSLVQHPA
ncbi:MAG: hypothetical protein AAF961_12790, partial [Planctomycetota bacterium]